MGCNLPCSPLHLKCLTVDFLLPSLLADTSFVASTEDALKLLPAFVQQTFPLKLTKKGAITLDLLDSIENDVATTGNFTAAAARVKEMSTQHYHKTQVRGLWTGCSLIELA